MENLQKMHESHSSKEIEKGFGAMLITFMGEGAGAGFEQNE